MFLNHVQIQSEVFPTKAHYPFNLSIFQNTSGLYFDTPVTFLIGENGAGKTTLLRALCMKCGIHIWEEMERLRVHHNPYQNKLHTALTIKWQEGRVPGSFFSSQMFRYFSEILDEWASSDPDLLDYFGGRSLLTQSHGQSLVSFFKARYKVRGLYLLDEPETALSPKSQIELLQLLTKLSQEGQAQFIIATHSPILLACPDAKIYSFDSSFIESVDYEETDYYQFYRAFLLNRDQFLPLKQAID